MTVVGEAFVDVLPDTTRFRAQLNAQLRSIQVPPVTIPVRLDQTALGAQLSRLSTTTTAAGGRGAVVLPVSVVTDAAEKDLNNFGNVTQRQLLGINRRVKKNFQDTGNEIDAILSSAGRRGAANLARNIDHSTAATKKLLQEFRNLLVLTAGISIVTRPFAALISSGVQAAGALEQTRVAFGGLLGGIEQGNAAIEQFRQFAAVTPFEFPGLVQAAQRFIGLGKTADETLNILRTVGDATAAIGADQEAIGRVTLAFTQIQAAGRLLAQDLNQITQALPNVTRGAVFAQLAEDMGKSTDEIRRLQEEGAIPADQALRSLLTVMREIPGAEGAMERQSRTLIGVFSTFKDEVRFALEDAFEPLIPILSQGLREAQPVVAANFREFGEVISGGLAETLPQLTELMVTLAPVLIDVTEALLALAPALSGVSAVLVAVEPALRAIADTLNAIPVPVLQAIGVITTLRFAFGGLGSALGGLVPRLEGFTRADLSGLTRMERAAGTARFAVGGLAGALGSLINPATFAVAGLGILTTGLLNAKRQAEQNKQEIDALTQAYDNLAVSVDKDTRLVADQIIANADLEKSFAQLAGGIDDFINLTQRGSQGFEQFIARNLQAGNISRDAAAQLLFAVDATKPLQESYQELAGILPTLSDRERDLAKAFLDQAGRSQEAAESAVNKALADKRLTKSEVDAAIAANQLSDGSTDFVGVLRDLEPALNRAAGAAADFGAGMIDLGDGTKFATSSFDTLDDAIKSVESAFQRTIGATLDAADAEDALADVNDRLTNLQQELRDELAGTAEEREAVARANQDLVAAEQAIVDAQEQANDAASELRQATEDLTRARETEAVRAAKQVADAERDLSRAKNELFDMETKLLELEKERVKANDPRRLKELANLERLRASVGAAPPSFIDDLEDRIDRLRQEVGPEALARIARETESTRLDIADQKGEIAEKTDALTEAQRQQKEGTDELREAEEAAADAADRHADANDAVAEASRRVRDAERDLRDAYRELQPDQTRVRDLQRDIERAQRDSIRAAFDLAVATATASQGSAASIKNGIGRAFDDLLAKFPQIKAELEKLPSLFTIEFELEVKGAPGSSFEETFKINPGVVSRQVGGSLLDNQISWVGENGPELFVKHQAGRILSNQESIAAVAQGIREAIQEALSGLETRAGATEREGTIIVNAPSTDARDVVDGIQRARRTAQHLRSIS